MYKQQWQKFLNETQFGDRDFQIFNTAHSIATSKVNFIPLYNFESTGKYTLEE